MNKRIMKKKLKRYLENLTYDQNMSGGHVRVFSRLVRRGYRNRLRGYRRNRLWDMWSQKYENAVCNRVYVVKVNWRYNIVIINPHNIEG